jgi:DMSO/TMAO reductase YedYZ molybdopterin-dependent catalytic subunit
MALRWLSRSLRSAEDARRPPIPVPDAGPFRRDFWRSPLRGAWLSSFLSAALLPLLIVCAATGFVSHAAYDPALGDNSLTGGFDDFLYFFDWPTRPAWLYALNQGVHVVSGVALIPILLAKLWAAIPKLFERPAVRSVSHMLERLSLALLVGSMLFLVFTGITNIQYWYPWGFFFTPAHYYAAFVFVASLAVHLALKLPVLARSFREAGLLAPLRSGSRAPHPSEHEISESAAPDPDEATISRRGMLAAVGAGSLGLVALVAGQSLGGFLRPTALLAPRGRSYGDGPNDFQVNKTARAAGIEQSAIGAAWQLSLVAGGREVALSREDLLALGQRTEELPIACVEGWTTWQRWTGVPLAELAELAGAGAADGLFVESIEPSGLFAQATLNPGQVADPRSLLALRVNGADLSLDHGYPARVVVPALPGVHNTKWVGRMTFREV